MSDRGGRGGWGDYRNGATKFGSKFRKWAHPSEYANALMAETRRIGVLWKDIYPWIERARAGDVAARDIVYASTYPIVLDCITQIKTQNLFSNVCYSEIVAVCFEVIEPAMQAFNPKLGSWSSFAYKCILNDLMNAWAKWKGMGLPSNIPHNGGMMTKRCYDNAAFKAVKTLDTTVAHFGFDDNSYKLTLKDSIPAKEEPPAPERFDPTLLASLNAVEASVLRARYGLGGAEPKTIDEVTKVLNRTRLWVRKTEAEALRRLTALQKKVRGA